MTDQIEDIATRVQTMVARAMKVFDRTQDALEGTLERLKDDETVPGTDIPKHINQLNSALMLALSLEAKARDATAQRQDRIGAGQLDLDGARAEIGVRLACLRAAGGGGAVPDGAE